MSIDRINISNQGIDRAQGTQSSELTRPTASNPQTSTGSDSVALSSKAKELDQLSNTVDQSRADRLNQVKAALDSGTYQVSARDVAQKLIDANTK